MPVPVLAVVAMALVVTCLLGLGRNVCSGILFIATCSQYDAENDDEDDDDGDGEDDDVYDASFEPMFVCDDCRAIK